MQDIAIKKINGEMQKCPRDKFLEIIGHYIIDRCSDADDAQRVAEESKTLGGAVKAVTDKARRVKNGDAAVLTHLEVFAAVDAYFGFEPDEAAVLTAMGVGPAPVAVPKKPKTTGVVVNLADFF